MKASTDLAAQWRERLQELEAAEQNDSDGARRWRPEIKVLRFLVRRYGGALEAPLTEEVESWMLPSVAEEIFEERPPEERGLERQILDEERVEAQIESALLPFKRREVLQEIARAHAEARDRAPRQSLLETSTRSIESANYQEMCKRQRRERERESQREFRQRQRERRAALKQRR